MSSTLFGPNSGGTQVSTNYGSIIVNPSREPVPNLPEVPQAIFDHSSHEDQNSPRYCYEGTRQELLQRIYAWAESRQEKHLFLLSGWPGTGKTAIARTVAKEYPNHNVSFMFGKGDQDCQSYAKFVTTVAKQLGKKSSSIRQSIYDALGSDPSILDKGLEDQWNRLVLEPLAHLPKPKMSFLLVIDALDECTNGEWLLRKLLQKESTGLRIFITSRPHILPPDLSNTRYHHIVLHDIEPAIVNRDIRLFFQMAVNPRRHGWPDASSLELLMHKANGIFEWAALASRFLNKSKGVYKTSLQKLLGDGVPHPPQRALSALYLTILDDYVKLQEWEPDSHFTCCGILRRYLGSLVVLFDQLSPRSFYKLIPSDTDDIDVHDILSNLKSIIDFPNDEENGIDKIRIHHSTFRDFLLDRELCTDDTFYVDKRAAHKVVLDGCLDLLLKTLKRGICQSDDPSFDHATAPSYPRQAIAPEIQYACLNWVAHLIECGGTFYENATISRLLLNHSLHWLEVLGCMGRSVEALNALEHLSSLAKCDKNFEILDFIEDLILFIRHNRNLMEENPQQLYTSGIIFAPSDSLVRQKFANEALQIVESLPKTHPRWPYCGLRSLEAHGGDVHILALSEGGRILASASSDLTIRLWDVITGKTLKVIEGFQDLITAIDFSKSGKQQFLATLSDREVRIWDVETGLCVTTLPSQQGYKAMAWMRNELILRVMSYDTAVEYWNPELGSQQGAMKSDEQVHHGTFLIFSGDTTAFATWSDIDPVHIWSATDNACNESVVLDNIGEFHLLSLSYDGTLLAAAERDIRLYDTHSGKKVFTLEGHLMNIRSLAFAPNSGLLASGSNDRTIKLWSLTTKQCLQQLKAHKLPVTSLTFSNASNLLASGSQDTTVRLWDIGTIPGPERQESSQGKLGRVTSVAVAENAEIIVVGFSSSCIHLHSMGNERCPLILQAHQDQISDLHFLENGKTLASASFDGTIQLWDTLSGQHLKTFIQYSAGIQSLVLTDDQEMLASILHDFTITTWAVQTGTLAILVGHTDYVETAVFSQPGRILASSSRDRSIRIWDTTRGTCLKSLNGHQGWVNGLAFTQDGSILVSASLDKTVRLWNISSGNCLSIIPHDSGVEGVAISCDQRILASTCLMRTIQIWDVTQKRRMQTIFGYSSRYLGLTPTGQYLITNHGTLALDMGPQGSNPCEQPRSVTYVNREWIYNIMERVLWIPPSYRNPKFLVVRDNTVVFVDDSGEVLVLRFH